MNQRGYKSIIRVLLGIVLDHVLELRYGTVFERREPGTGCFYRFIDLKQDGNKKVMKKGL